MNPNRTFCLLMLAGCAGWTVATPFEGVSRPYLATVAAATVLVTAGFRTVDAGRLRWLAGGEMAAVIGVPVGVFAVGALFGPLDESSLLAGLLSSFLVWLVAAITFTDIEAVTEPTDLVEGLSGALGRITTRMVLIGAGLMIAVVAGDGGLGPVSIARPIRSGLVVPFLLYWVTGLGGLATLNRSRLLARWKRDRYKVDEDLGARWQGATLLWLAVPTAAALVWFLVARPLLASGHSIVANALRLATDLIGRLVGLDLPTANPVAGPPVTVTTAPPAEVNPFTPPSEWFDLFLLVIAGAIFAFAFVGFGRRLRRRGSSVPTVLWSVLRSVWSTLLAIMRELGLLVLSLIRRDRARGTLSSRGHRRRRHDPAPGWSPSDPYRRRVAAEYRAFLSAAIARMGPLRLAETPSELAERIVADEASSAVGVLTGIYELARFSDDQLDEAKVRQAQEARLEITGRWAESG